VPRWISRLRKGRLFLRPLRNRPRRLRFTRLNFFSRPLFCKEEVLFRSQEYPDRPLHYIACYTPVTVGPFSPWSFFFPLLDRGGESLFLTSARSLSFCYLFLISWKRGPSMKQVASSLFLKFRFPSFRVSRKGFSTSCPGTIDFLCQGLRGE